MDFVVEAGATWEVCGWLRRRRAGISFEMSSPMVSQGRLLSHRASWTGRKMRGCSMLKAS